MPITFRCEHCRKEVEAPEAAAGKRGKCPYCKQSNYIPAPVSEDEILSLAPLDEDEERRREAVVRELRDKERALIAASGSEPGPGLEQQENVSGEDLHHFVVNYCLDMANSNLERAGTHVEKLRKFGPSGALAVEDFRMGRVLEPTLGDIPDALVSGFLKQLADQLR